VNWFRHCGLGFHASGWLAFAMVILLALVPGTALLKLVIWLFKRNATQTRVRTKAKGSIGAYMEDKRAESTQEIVCAFSPASPQFLRPSTDGLHAEQEHGTKKGLAMRD
jgi:hypothetical protein